MKKCSYCGAEYPDDALVCPIDRTPFDPESPPKISDAARSPLCLALTSGLASLLICTAVYFATGRIMRDIITARGLDRGTAPGTWGELSFIYPGITWSLFLIGALCFTFYVCYHRSLKESHGVVTAIVSFGIIASLVFGPMLAPGLSYLYLVFPTVLVGLGTRSSAGFYIGAVLQVIVGAWLLGRFRRGTPPNNALQPTATAP